MQRTAIVTMYATVSVLIATAALLALFGIWMLYLYRSQLGRSQQIAVAFADLEATLAATEQQLQRAQARQLRAERKAQRESDFAKALAHQKRQLGASVSEPRQLFLALDSKLGRAHAAARRAGDLELAAGYARKRDAVQSIILCLNSAGLDDELLDLGRDLGEEAGASAETAREDLIRARARRLIGNQLTLPEGA